MSGLIYLHISQLLTGLMLAVIFGLVWKTIDRKQYILFWAFSFLVLTLGGMLNGLKPFFPSRDLYWIIVNALSLIAQGLGLAGFRVRAGRKAFPNALLIYLLAVELVLIWFTIVMPHAGLKMVLIPFSGAIMALVGCKVIMSKTSPLHAAEWGVISVYVIFSIAQFTAGTFAFMQGVEADPYYNELYRQTNFIAMPALFTGLGLFTVLIVTDDLSTRMKKLAITDQLTGVLNRRGFEDAAIRAKAMADRKQTPTTVVVADIDFFKKINDNFGHRFGDKAIKAFTKKLEETIRDTDIIGRVGGEEFVILMQDTDLDDCTEVTERLRAEVDALNVTSGKKAINLTASFGIAMFNRDETLEQAVHNADQALYKAKDNGRNRVEVYLA